MFFILNNLLLLKPLALAFGYYYDEIKGSFHKELTPLYVGALKS